MTVQLSPMVMRTQGAETMAHANGHQHGPASPNSATPSFESALLAWERQANQLSEYSLGMARLNIVQEGQTSLMRIRNSITLALAETYWTAPGVGRSSASAPSRSFLKNPLVSRVSSNRPAEALPNRANQDLLRSASWAALSLTLQRSEWADRLASMRQS